MKRVLPITALDFATFDAALAFVQGIGSACDFYKVGLELFTATGPRVVQELRARGKRVFLDLKFHDIPNTVHGAARNAALLGAELITVHASGGREMLESAVAGAAEGQGAGGPCKVLAVSVLTSLDSSSLQTAWGRREEVETGEEVVRLAHLARASGTHGLVCSPLEAARVRKELGADFELLVPGIRLEGGAAHDQKRVATPGAARDAGADYIILGRAVTQAPDPAAVLRRVERELAGR